MSNFRNVLKVYSLMRAFDADDNALLNTLRGATEPELELLREMLAPTKGTGKGLKKTRKPASRSPRAASLAGAIAGTARVGKCTFMLDEKLCERPATDAIHDLTYSSSHPFTPAVAQASGRG